MFRNFINVFIKNRFALIAFLFLFLGIAYYFLLLSFEIGKKQALYESLFSLILILFFSFILQRIHSFYHSRSAISIVHVSIILIFSFLSAVIIQESGEWIGTQDHKYIFYLKNAFYLRWLILFLMFLTIVNQLWIDKHLSEQSNTLNRLVEQEKQLAKAEMNNLQQQFQPHFLFNSLNSISALVKPKPEQARSMIHNLSDYLRMTIQKDKDEFISIQDEIDYLNLYLSIERVRFGHRLKIEIEKAEDTEGMILPSLLLQPIVENAIKYGLYANIGDLTISISISNEEGLLQISVTNPFDENIVDSNKGTGYGLASVKRKLKLVYKRDDLLTIQKKENQFIAILKIPQL